jgi:hypothetical protein
MIRAPKIIARAIRLGAALLLMLTFASSPVFAWGSAAHRYIMERAIDLLPVEIKPFFDAHRDELAMRVNDPDLWRVVGWDEAAHHFLDLDGGEYGRYPFAELPRDYDAAAQKFGPATVKRYGLLPWRTAEMYGNLRRALQNVPRATPYAASNVVLFSAVTAHYVQDAHQPLHATVNYDGQQTEQRGVHARFEEELFARYHGELAQNATRPRAMNAPRDAMFEILLESHRLVAPLLAAEKKAAAGSRDYDNRYYSAFFAEARPILEGRIAQSVTATASMIMGAWVAAGRPALRVASSPTSRSSSNPTSTVAPSQGAR